METQRKSIENLRDSVARQLNVDIGKRVNLTAKSAKFAKI